jgi:hypothetical protein
MPRREEELWQEATMLCHVQYAASGGGDSFVISLAAYSLRAWPGSFSSLFRHLDLSNSRVRGGSVGAMIVKRAMMCRVEDTFQAGGFQAVWKFTRYGSESCCIALMLLCCFEVRIPILPCSRHDRQASHRLRAQFSMSDVPGRRCKTAPRPNLLFFFAPPPSRQTPIDLVL